MIAEHLNQLLSAQRNEITEYHIYTNLLRTVNDPNNRSVLERIAADEMCHYEELKRLTGVDVAPNRIRVWWYTLISRLLGLSFGLRLMEQDEQLAEEVYKQLQGDVTEVTGMLADEQVHEAELLNMIEEERIKYAGAVVLGLNDALVELTGALAGLTFALQNGRLIAITGLITGIAASMSMGASAFFSTREEGGSEHGKSPLKSAAYTGSAYIVTVLLLVAPYIYMQNVYLALATMLVLSVLVVLAYNFYIATAKGLKLWRRFSEMIAVSLSVAFISFLVGLALRHWVGVEP